MNPRVASWAKDFSSKRHHVAKPPPADCLDVVQRPLEYANGTLTKLDIECYNVEMIRKLLGCFASTNHMVSDVRLTLKRLRLPIRQDFRRRNISWVRPAPTHPQRKIVEFADVPR